MKRIFVFLVAGFMFTTLHAASTQSDTLENIIENWLTAGPVQVKMPVFANQNNLHGKKFTVADLLKFEDKKVKQPKVGKTFEGEAVRWQKTAVDKNGDMIVGAVKATEYYLFRQATYIHLAQFLKIEIKVKSNFYFELYVDGKKEASNYSKTATGKEPISKTISLKLEKGRHLLFIKALYHNDSSKVRWEIETTYKILTKKIQTPPVFNLSPETSMDINHLMNGKRLSGVSVSSTGAYYLLRYSEFFPPNGKNESWSEIVNAANNKVVFSSRYASLGNIQWIPQRNAISYTTKRGGKNYLISLNINSHIEKIILQTPKEFNTYTWSTDGSFLIYNVSDKLKRDKSGVYKIEGMPDRWPWYRSRSQLFLLRMDNLTSTRLTWGYLTNSLQDISPDGRHILFSQSIPQYSERPYYKQVMMQMNLATMKIDTLWEQNFGGNATYSPDGKKLLVTGSAAMFNGAGVNLKKAKIPNDFDVQAYIYDIKSGKVHSITGNFNPSVIDAHWNTEDKTIYIYAEDRTYRNIWRYRSSNGSFEALQVKTDVVNNLDFSHTGHTMVYYGSSITYPAVAYIFNLQTGRQKLIADPEKAFFKNVQFGKTEDWDFKNKKGLTIVGRIYYPPGFDITKKYPLIVYYYGGTSPTSRNFGGRYPKNLFAAAGYVVYVLQPSGATGFGQDFSALHVNKWGEDNANDIIEGTKKFLKIHSFINKDAVGCLGASYGGYMTMFLQTKTDIFSAAVAHAGISSISSYWGQGYWGYLYSAVASANSFPWNNRKLYVDHSPLFNAEKINTPLLLLHGTADTNVPTGESIQLYTALKLLGKTVALVEIKGQNHHIVDYKKRIRWQKTILAWFDKYLKSQNEWWNELYPKKDL